ncbi:MULTISPECIES: helix-turn-helix transcriptional regulator [unclassified Streptomyces]|uniref:helix-turn-helix domain-containing protein n=1 Tax=unclassified Streptomyces TaxID=2593676 RepID=UPI0033257AEF
MNSLYERLAKSATGARRLASARLRHEVLRKLFLALEASGMTQSALADALKIRKSAVNQTLRGDGNLRVTTLAEYLHALGYELNIRLVPAGEPRLAAVEDRDVRVAPIEAPKQSTPEPSLVRHCADPAPVETSIHVLGGTDRDLLLEMSIHPVGQEASEYKVEGRIHVVPKDLPSDFAPLKHPEVV